MSISLCLIFLEVYFNWTLESQKADNKLASYGKNTKTSRNRKSRTGCTSTPLTCTGTCLVLEGCTGTHSRCIGSRDPKMSRMCIFSLFSIFLIPNSSLYFIYTSRPLQSHLEISIFTQFIFQYFSFFQKHIKNPSKTILIWVKTHTQTNYDD